MTDVAALLRDGSRSAFYHELDDGRVLNGFVVSGLQSIAVDAEEVRRLGGATIYERNRIDGTPVWQVRRKVPVK